MLYPTINDLTKGEYNRYELALATAKCARLVTNEYVKQREEAERSMTGNKDTDRPLISMIDPEYRDEKAVRVAVSRLSEGEYNIVRLTPEEMEEAAREEAMANDTPPFAEIPDKFPDDNEEARLNAAIAGEKFPEESAEDEETENEEGSEDVVADEASESEENA